MQTKSKQEEAVLKEIRDLPEIIQEKILKIIHFSGLKLSKVDILRKSNC